MPHVIFPEFRDEYKSTRYPFLDTATLTSLDGSLTLPSDLFADASIYIPGAVAPVYIQSIIVGTTCSITVCDYSKAYRATGTINPLADTIELYNDSGNQVGIIVSAQQNLSYFVSLSTGEYTFTPKATSFVPRCFIPLQATGVTSIGIEDGDTLQGDVWLCGKDGIVIRAVSDSEIRIDIVGEPLYKQTVDSENTDYHIPNPIRTINGIEPDSKGNFKISVLDSPDILRINNTPDGIQIFAAGV